MTLKRAQASKSFTSDERGNIAIITGFTFLVIGGSVALGLDYGRAIAVRGKLQSAVDAAALAAKPDPAQPDQTQANAAANFDFSMQGAQLGALSVNVTSEIIPNGVRVRAQADVPTSFGRLVGQTSIPVAVMAEAVSAKGGVEIALVLDNTFSMSGSKLDGLKTSAKKLVDQVVANSGAGSVKFALVPFSNYVNIGTTYRGSSWLTVQADYSETVTNCWTTTDWAGCPTQTVSGTCYNDGVPYSCNTQQCVTPGPAHQQCWTGQINHTWNGCAGSRKPQDLAALATSASPVPGVLDVSCPSPLARLTTDDTAVQSEIDGMVAQGETYIASGLMWGWRALTPDQPFADGSATNSNPRVRKIMILMTDGANTKSQVDITHEGSDTVAADTTMGQLCTNIKDPNGDNIVLYTIAFTVTDPAAKTRLQNCATDGNHFFDAADNAALDQAFSLIAGSLVKLSLSK